MDFILNLDKKLFHIIHYTSGRLEILDWLGVFFAEDSRVFMGGLFFLGLFLVYRNSSDKSIYNIFFAAIIFLLPVITSNILREVIMRPRPFVSFDISPLIEQSIRPSLPSNHTAASFAVAGMYLAFIKRHFKTVFILACLVALARIYAGTHYPLDVLAGAFIGILPGIVVYYKKDNNILGNHKTKADRKSHKKKSRT